MFGSARPYSASATLRDDDPCAGPEPPQQPPQAGGGKRYASGSGPQARAGHMHKYRTATTGDSRPRVVIELNDEIVETIIAPQAVAAGRGIELHRPIVAPVAGILAPGVVSTDTPHGQPGRRARGAIRAPPEAKQPKAAARRAAVALALVGANAPASERD